MQYNRYKCHKADSQGLDANAGGNLVTKVTQIGNRQKCRDSHKNSEMQNSYQNKNI